jgi:hypothetical protein
MPAHQAGREAWCHRWKTKTTTSSHARPSCEKEILVNEIREDNGPGPHGWSVRLRWRSRGYRHGAPDLRTPAVILETT